MSEFNIPMEKPDTEWVALLETKNCLLEQDDKNPKRQELKHVLKAAGFAAIIDDADEVIDAILARGEFVKPVHAKYVSGFPNQCHYNSACYWNSNQEICSLMTGYALSIDGMWRQHSWCLLQKDPRSEKNIEETVVETTAERVLYYGFRLTNKEAESFVKWNQ